MKKTTLLFLSAFLLSGSTLKDKDFRPGKDFALFFAVNDYDHWDDLANPISEVEAIAKDLKDLYGFDTAIVRNPNKKAILDKIEEYRKKTYDKDAQLLIFFSGHGEFNEVAKQGFFVPKSGLKQDEYGETYIEYEYLKRRISSLPCEHILLALDACYSGTADESIAMRGNPGKRPGDSADGERERYIETSLQYKTRIMLTSGAKLRTPDKSQFAAKFLEALRARGGQDGLLNTHELLSYLITAQPKPVTTQFGDHAPGGEFLFLRQTSAIVMGENDLDNKETDFAIDKAALISENASLQAERASLTKKVDVASAIRVKNVTVKSVKVRNNGTETSKSSADGIDKLTICFTAEPNEVTFAGEEIFYIRIVDPTGAPLAIESLGSGVAYDKKTDEEFRYTTTAICQYNNSETNVCGMWQPGQVFLKGKYLVEIYNKGYLVGSGGFQLK